MRAILLLGALSALLHGAGAAGAADEAAGPAGAEAAPRQMLAAVPAARSLAATHGAGPAGPAERPALVPQSAAAAIISGQMLAAVPAAAGPQGAAAVTTPGEVLAAVPASVPEGAAAAARPAGPPEGPAGAEPAGPFARMLMGGTGPCYNSARTPPPANAAWTAANSCNNPEGQVQGGVECTAACGAGFVSAGRFIQTCVFESWIFAAVGDNSLTCTVPGCSGTPSAAGFALPSNAQWACGASITSTGSSCTAECAAGYKLFGGPWASTCGAGGAWQAPSGTAITCGLIVPAGPCPNDPGPATAGLPDNAAWACSGTSTASGTTCKANCKAGFGNVAATTYEAACLDGLWQQPTGDLTCAVATAPCPFLPPSTWLPAGGKWDCPTGVSQGGACTASCEAAYSKTGNLIAFCFNGAYAQPNTAMTCSPAGCSGNPSGEIDPDAVWSCASPSLHGAKCAAGCKGVAAPPNPPTVICDYGSWVYSNGSCADETTRNFFFTITAPDELIDPGLLPFSQSSVKVTDTWISQSNSTNQKRRLLAVTGKSLVVVGVQVSVGSGTVAQAAGALVNAAFSSPAASNFILAQGLDVLRGNFVEENLLQQVTLGLSDSTGRFVGEPAGAGGCLVEMLPTTTANDSIGILSTQQRGPVFDVNMCSGWDTLYASYQYKASSSVTGATKLTAAIINSTTTRCTVSPESTASRASLFEVACKNLDGTSFSAAANYAVLVTANYTCGGQPSAFFDTTNVAVLTGPSLALRAGKQPEPGCGGKPAVAVFRYNLKNLQLFQDFQLTAQVAPSCTARLISRPSKSNGLAVVTCSGAFPPGVPVAVGLNLTASVQGCRNITSAFEISVPVTCCVTGSSYAKGATAASPSCFGHFKPGTTAAQCSKPVNASGYLNRGPGNATLFLAQSTSSCSDSFAVGSVSVTCPDGASGQKLRFSVTSPASRSADRRYLVLCSAPTAPLQCPNPRWISTRAKPGQPGLPEGLNTTTANGARTEEFSVSARCPCSSAYYAVVETVQYRNLPAAACSR
uniref:Sushi domain-containing protein n=1 Tax=Tetradesmus obliquus TaxID=3088 RepID=A0A383WDT9_TETOB|eukprot:jgi/Sobl393_1/5356/SZX75775.1